MGSCCTKSSQSQQQKLNPSIKNNQNPKRIITKRVTFKEESKADDNNQILIDQSKLQSLGDAMHPISERAEHEELSEEVEISQRNFPVSHIEVFSPDNDLIAQNIVYQNEISSQSDLKYSIRSLSYSSAPANDTPIDPGSAFDSPSPRINESLTQSDYESSLGSSVILAPRNQFSESDSDSIQEIDYAKRLIVDGAETYDFEDTAHDIYINIQRPLIQRSLVKCNQQSLGVQQKGLPQLLSPTQTIKRPSSAIQSYQMNDYTTTSDQSTRKVSVRAWEEDYKGSDSR